MSEVGKRIFIHSMLSLMAAALLLMPTGIASAHGGEDHGDQKVQTVSAAANMTIRAVRAGDYEAAIKYPNIVPDRETVARVFLTRFDTNEPVTKAKITLLLEGTGRAPVEVAATATATPGSYESKLPPTPPGDIKLSARIETGGATEVATIGAIKVAPPQAEAAADGALWARTALIVMGLVALVSLFAALIFIAVSRARRDRVRTETATA